MSSAVATPQQSSVATAHHRRRPARTVPSSTPSWLRRASALTAALAVLAAVLSLAAVLDRQSATSAARSSAEPLLVDSQTVITSLSDADATVAGGFLAGRVQPASASSEFADDLARAAAAVAAASRLAGTGSAGRSAQIVAVDIPAYASTVQTAVTDQREGQPVASSYLSEASGFLHSQILPAATGLYHDAQTRLADDSSGARSTPLAVIAVIFGVAALVFLARLQVQMARRFHRLFNVPAIIGSVLALAAVLWLIVAFSVQGGNVGKASSTGTGPLNRYIQARILALQAHADDELTLVTRDAVPSYEQDYGTIAPTLTKLVDQNGAPYDEQNVLTDASSDWSNYEQAHTSVRQADSDGNLTQAISNAQSGELPSASGALDADLANGINTAQGADSRDLGAASGDLDALAVGVTVLLVLAGGLVVVGVERRRAEYR